MSVQTNAHAAGTLACRRIKPCDVRNDAGEGRARAARRQVTGGGRGSVVQPSAPLLRRRALRAATGLTKGGDEREEGGREEHDRASEGRAEGKEEDLVEG